MAADQRKKRVNAASLVGCTSREQYRVNRKKHRVQKHDLNMSSNISLEWDNNKKSVVSKREQIGIAQRHLIPFIEPGPPGHSILADVFSVPHEIFELENLSEVLSYEVWQSHLSDSERCFLSQFLPKVPEPDRIVRDLLGGANFHFGNPFVKWGASLCYGELHPDIILHEEQSLDVGKKTYYSDLQKYHYGMIENLQAWKKKWTSCKDPEVDIVQNIWSSRRHVERTVLPLETRFCGTEATLVASPESCSWTNSEMAYSSDNQNSGTMDAESHRRNGFLKKKSDNSSSGLKVVAAISKKGEQLHKRNIQHSDGAKYMSYIKVSREQHERVKSSLKHSSNSIHQRSLNNVLGINALNVQPYERFVEEEKKKLHQHWLKLATEDILEGFTNWSKRQSERQELTRSLGEEIVQKLELQTILNEEKESSLNKQMELSDDSEEETLPSITIEGVEKEQSENLLQEDSGEAIQEVETKIEDEKEAESDYIFEKRTHDDSKMSGDEVMPIQVLMEDHNNQRQQIVSLNNSPRSTMITPPSPVFYQDQPHQKICSINSNPQDEMQSDCDNASPKTDDEDPSIISGYPGDPLPSCSDIWSVGDVHGSYYQSTATNIGTGYAPAGQELSIGNPQFMLDKDVAGKDMMLHRHTTTDDMSFFNPYSNQDRNELLHSLFKGHQSNIMYQHQQKHLGLEFHPGNDLMVEAAGQFPVHHQYREQVHPTVLPPDLRQKRQNDHHMYHHLHHHQHNNVQESSMYSGGRFPIMSRQEDLPGNIHDWAAVNSVRMPVPSQPLNQSWYGSNNTGDTGTTRDGWPSLEVGVGGNHNSLGTSIRNSDQTLFSVLSECNELPPRASYDTMGPIQVGNYGIGGIGMGIGGGIPPGSSSFLQQSTSNPLNYLNGGHEVAGGIKMNNLGWMGMPQQNSGIHDSLGKSFLRSWNQ